MATPTSLPSTFVAGNVLTAAEMNALRGAFRVLQVVSTTKTDTFTTTNSSYTAVTGLSASITPSSVDSKILVQYSVNFGLNAGSDTYIMLAPFRDGTNLVVPTSPGSRTATNLVFNANGMTYAGNQMLNATAIFLDSPATTSAVTYDIRILNTTTESVFVNRDDIDTNASDHGRGVSTITVMEVSA